MSYARHPVRKPQSHSGGTLSEEVCGHVNSIPSHAFLEVHNIQMIVVVALLLVSLVFTKGNYADISHVLLDLCVLPKRKK